MKMALSVYNILKGCGSFRVLTTLLSLFIVSACGSTKLAYKDSIPIHSGLKELN